jgi:VanZ family protein
VGIGNLAAGARARQGERHGTAAGEAPLARSTSSLFVFLRYWVPVLVYIAIIFTVSSVANLTPPVDFKNADKLAHLVEYTLLGFLLVRAFFGARLLASLVACGLLAVIAGLLTGLADEVFQAGVPGRVSSAADFRVDSLGVVVGSIVYSLARRLRAD